MLGIARRRLGSRCVSAVSMWPPPSTDAPLCQCCARPTPWSADGESTSSDHGDSDAEVPEAARRGWGRRYMRREMEEATGGLAAANMMGERGYDVVFRGVLWDGTAVAIKNLHNNSATPN